MAIVGHASEPRAKLCRFPSARFGLSAESVQSLHCITLDLNHVSHAQLLVSWFLCPSLAPFGVDNSSLTTTDLALVDYFKWTPDYRHS